MVAWYDTGAAPIDPGGATPDLNLIQPGILPPGMPSPVTPAANPIGSTMYAGMALSAIGSVVNAFSQSAADKAQGGYESSIANTNAAIASVQARQTLETGDIEASRENLKTQQAIGSERAAQGASGVDVASGSSALTRIGTAGVGAIDELTIRNNAARQAWGYQTQALSDTYQGQFAELSATAKSQQSLLTGGLQAVSGPLAIESNYLRFARYMGVGGSSEVNRGNAGVPFPNMN